MTWKRIRRCQCERMRTRAGGAESRRAMSSSQEHFTVRHPAAAARRARVYGLQLRRLRMLLKYKVGVGAPAQRARTIETLPLDAARYIGVWREC